MRRDNHGRKRSGKGFDDKTKYARLLGDPCSDRYSFTDRDPGDG